MAKGYDKADLENDFAGAGSGRSGALGIACEEDYGPQIGPQASNKGGRMTKLHDELEALCRRTIKTIDLAMARGVNIAKFWIKINLWPLMMTFRGDVQIPDEPVIGSNEDACNALAQVLAAIDAQRLVVTAAWPLANERRAQPRALCDLQVPFSTEAGPVGHARVRERWSIRHLQRILKLPRSRGYGRMASFWKILLAGALGLCVALNSVRADDRDEEIKELRSRLEKLERTIANESNGAKPDDGITKTDKQVNSESDTDNGDGWFEIGKHLGLKGKWDYGIWLATEDEAFRIHFAGRLQVDGIWVNANDRVQFGAGGIGKFDDAVNFRRVRLGVDGWFYEVFDYNCQVDFVQTVNDDPTLPANAATNVIPIPALADVWASMNYLPIIGTFRVGNMKPPLLLEHLTSSRFLDFLERSPLFDVNYHRNGGYMPGLQILNWTENERLTWQLGVFKNSQTLPPWIVGDGDYQVNGRLTFLPFYENEGRCMMHLGLGMQYDEPEASVGAFLRDRFLLRNGPPTTQATVAQAILNGHHQAMAAPEFFMNVGGLSIQAEYLANHMDNITSFQTQSQGLVLVKGASRGYFSQGAYIQVLYFLTGEHRPYNRTGLHSGEGAGPTRVVPIRNVFWVRGDNGDHLFSLGAWQIGARYAYSDLSNNGIFGGQVNEVTLGVNWFLNPNMKIQWNYDVGYRGQLGPASASNGSYQGVGTRLAIDW